MIYLIADFQYNTISGSTIDYIDLYYNLKKYLPVKLIILVNYNKYLSVKKLLLSYFNKKIVKELIKYFRINTDNIKENDTIICKYGCLLDNYINIEKYKNIYIIADLRLACHCIVNINRYYLYHSNIKGIFTSPFLKKYYENHDILHEYYVKLSKYRLDNIVINNTYNNFNDWENYYNLKNAIDFNIHKYKKLTWFRHQVENQSYCFNQCLEMKGKLIFEFLYFGKQVHYSPINKQFDDGLTDYLSLFNIDDNKEQDLNISKEEIFDKLVKFDETDQFLRYITNY